MQKKFGSFAAFYPFYLSEHKNKICRRLHVIGNCFVLFLVVYALTSQRWLLLCLSPLVGYGFAWLGHFGFEKNRPATFKYPLYSFIADWVMFKDYFSGRLER